MKHVTVHTDGGCRGNPGPGGWAAVLTCRGRTKEISGSEPATTNNRMELRAAIEALRALREPCAVTVHTDSRYLRDGITRWVAAWKRRGWLTIVKKSVKNRDLWMALDEQVERHQVTWRWLRGHAGHLQNERCDRLARAEIEELARRFSAAELEEHLRRFRSSNPEPTPSQESLL